MKKIVNNILASFDNHTNGYSGRKLSAFAAVVAAVYITVYRIPSAQEINALYAWLLFSLLCLGIVTAEHILKFKNGKDETNTRN